MDNTGNTGAMDDVDAIGPILASIGHELTGLSATAEHMQDILSPLLLPGLLSNPDTIMGLQELDRLTQTLRALSSVALQLSRAADAGWKIDLEPVLAAVPLAGLVKNLRANQRFDAAD